MLSNLLFRYSPDYYDSDQALLMRVLSDGCNTFGGVRDAVITVDCIWAIFIGIHQVTIHNCSNIIMLSSKD